MGQDLTRKKVFVGISGGVDSSVSAALLVEQGYDVTGVFIRVWQPPFLECSIKDDRRDAMRVCAQLGIPFLECDAEEAYKTQVIDYMMSEYKKGRTPNPDVMCNKYVKFGIFYNWAIQNGADYVATGHYAQVKEGKLFKGVSTAKDQSYFLAAIGPDKLSKVLFPIGGLEKDKVRELAKKYKLFTAEKKDSQGLCFLGKLDVKDFLKKFIEPKSGNVLNQNGEIIGKHDGAFFFTLGERHGFTITTKSADDEALYVISKSIENNTITVAPRSTLADNRLVSKVVLEDVVIYNKEALFKKDSGSEITAVYRYHGESLHVQSVIETSNGLEVHLLESRSDIAPGQIMVLYHDNELIAAGSISLS